MSGPSIGPLPLDRAKGVELEDHDVKVPGSERCRLGGNDVAVVLGLLNAVPNGRPVFSVGSLPFDIS